MAKIGLGTRCPRCGDSLLVPTSCTIGSALKCGSCSHEWEATQLEHVPLPAEMHTDASRLFIPPTIPIPPPLPQTVGVIPWCVIGGGVLTDVMYASLTDRPPTGAVTGACALIVLIWAVIRIIKRLELLMQENRRLAEESRSRR